ncbi:MAG: hypothetical protein ACYCVD_18220 [Desulfitobacteriaceae bacterium]
MQIKLQPAQSAVPGCPLCGAPGQRVRKVTVEHQVLPTVALQEDTEGYSAIQRAKPHTTARTGRSTDKTR